MDKKKKQRKILIQFISFVAICLFTLFVNLFFSKADVYKNIHIERSLSKRWVCELNGSEYGTVDLANERFPIMNKGDQLTVKSMIPGNLPIHPVLKIYSIHSITRVYIDGVLRYQYGNILNNRNELLGYGYHYISLYESDRGKEITIDYQITEDSAFSTVDPPLITSGNFVHRDFMIQNRVRTGIILFLILFGLVISVVAIVYSFKDTGMLKLLCIGLFSITIGLWSLCTTSIVGIYTYSLQTKTFLEFGCLYLAPPCLSAYFYSEIKKESKRRWIIYNILLWQQVIFAIGSWILQITNIVHFPVVLKICHVLIFEMVVFMVVRFFLDMFRGNLHDGILIIGFEFLIVFVSMDLFRFNFTKYLPFIGNDHYVSLVYFGVLLFVLAMLVDFGVKYIRNMYEKIESETLEKLAFTDYLTGLSNRRSIENLMDDIDAKGDDFAVIGYDLNDLKKVNDTLGHEEGDRYIKEFAGALLNAFAGLGLSGRTGGDEFVTVLPHGKNLDIEARLLELDENIRKINEQNSNWSMSVAYGIARAGEEGADSVRHAAKIADNRMYVRKKEMKANR